jgi:putative ATP-dependent endonuclease of OLD family
MKLAQTDVSAALSTDAKASIATLNETFQNKTLPDGLDIGLIGGQGASITAMIGLTAKSVDTKLPLTSWGAGTRRLAALVVAEAKQGEAPIVLVDEVERGLEPYRQRMLVQGLQDGPSQIFLTTHSPAAISAAAGSHFWYLDHVGSIGELNSKKIARQREADAETFLAKLAIVVEGRTEVGFVTALLERAFNGPLSPHGIHICDGGGHESALELLEALSEGGLKFGGFVDEEDGKHPTRWSNVMTKQGLLLFRWSSGCTEQNLIGAVSESDLEVLVTDPNGAKTGTRLRSLADQLGIEDKSFATLKATAAGALRSRIIDAAVGVAPAGTPESERKSFKTNSQLWFKSIDGGRELATKMFSLGLWASFKSQLLPFCNAVRQAVELPEIEDLTP